MTAPRRSVPPVFVVNAAMRLRRWLLRLADSVVPPHLAILDRQMGAATSVAVHLAAKARLADHLVAGPKTAAELGAATGLDPARLDRVLRALVAGGVFSRDTDGTYRNNKVSLGLREGQHGSARGFAEFFGYPEVLRAWADLPETVAAGGNGFSRVHGESAWAWLARAPAARAAFTEGMGAVSEMAAPAIAAAYPFGEVKVLCDVGGGVGAVLAAVLERHPHLRGVLYDDPSMLQHAPARLGALVGRVDLTPGSFFGSVPRGADGYLLKTVLHNWDDAAALRVLRNCRAAMDPGHRVIVVDFIAADDAISTLVPAMDLLNMVIFEDGRERTVAELGALFADAGFRLGRVTPIPGCQSVVEGIAV